MCGRFAAFSDDEDLVAGLGVDLAEPGPGGFAQPGASYNIEPTQTARIVLTNPHTSTTVLGAGRWGLIPPWAKDPGKVRFTFNARREGIMDKPTFAPHLAFERCVVPMDGYYEWARPDGPLPAKQPYYLTSEGDGPLWLAGLYGFYRDLRGPVDAAGEEDKSGAGDDGGSDVVHNPWLVSFTIITGPASGELGDMHARRPIALDREQALAWLDPTLGGEYAPAEVDELPAREKKAARQRAAASALDLLPAQRSGPAIRWYPISRAVGNIRNNGPELVEQVDGADADGAAGGAGGGAGSGK